MKDHHGEPARWVCGVVYACVTTACISVAATTAEADPPPGYYDSASGLSGEALRLELHEIIDDHLRYPYTSSATDTWDIVAEANEDPSNANNVLTVYRNKSADKDDHSSGTGWNREHSWPNSYGFSQDGGCNSAYTDCHQLFPADWSYNSSRGNNPYDDCLSGCSGFSVDGFPGLFNWRKGSGPSTGVWEAWDNKKGDVARAILYMEVRYEGGSHGGTGCSEPDLRLTDNRSLIVADSGNNFSPAYMGMLTILLDWHLADPPDDFERDRNDVIFSYQGNRNPFVDHPEFVCDIWACAGDMMPPAAPVGLVATDLPCGVEIDWDDNTEPDLAGYNIWRATGAGGPYTLQNGTLLATSEYFDEAADAGQRYWYIVSARDTSGNESGFSGFVSGERDGSPCEDPITPWINEFHYDNSGTDLNEQVEIAGPAGTDLTGWTLVGYNGTTGASYDTIALSGTLPDQENGFGTRWFSFSGLQNGSPDGMALIDPDQNVIQFLSYEGLFVAGDGPAAGETSENVGVAEDSSTPSDFSLQLMGTGSRYEDFTWQVPASHTRGLPNHDQTFSTSLSDCQGVDDVDVLTVLTGGADVEEGFRVSADAADSLDFTIVKPAAGGNGKFLAHLNAGSPTASSVTALPAQLGDACFPLLIPPFGTAAPVAVWNGIGKANKVGSSEYFGSPIADPGRAPITFYSVGVVDVASMPVGTSWTLQAVILNPAASSPKAASVTNAIVVDVE